MTSYMYNEQITIQVYILMCGEEGNMQFKYKSIKQNKGRMFPKLIRTNLNSL